MRPMIRSFAARNLSVRQKSNIRNIACRLGGYAVFEADQDTIALRRDTATFRRKNAADSKAA
jgi:hypothetical protein